MNGMSDVSLKKTTDNENQLSAIDSLRTSIEHEHRFKTSFTGYRKSDVQAYLDKLSEQFKKAVDALELELDNTKKENSQLYILLESQKEKTEAVRIEERQKLQLEYDMQEGLVKSLREENSKLFNDNQDKQVEIAALNEQISGFRSIATERSKQLDILSDSLAKLLNIKFTECSDIVTSWKTEYHDVVETENSQVTEP